MTFTLRMTHLGRVLRRLDCAGSGQVSLSPGGATGDRILGERLELTWQRKALSFELGGTMTETPRVDGVVIATSGALHAGARLEWRGWTIEVGALAPLTQEERAQLDAARTSDAALLVYADALESRGAADDANWSRLVVDAAKNAEKLQALTERVPSSHKAHTARADIERCAERCGQRWEALPLGESPWVRRCGRCGEDVSWAETPWSAPDFGPVVVDPGAPREPGDLLPSPMPVG